MSDLQEPIAELAKGNLTVKFKPAEHREISEIVEALESTASALSERDARLLKLANHDVLTGLFNRRRLVCHPRHSRLISPARCSPVHCGYADNAEMNSHCVSNPYVLSRFRSDGC